MLARLGVKGWDFFSDVRDPKLPQIKDVLELMCDDSYICIYIYKEATKIATVPLYNNFEQVMLLNFDFSLKFCHRLCRMWQ